MRAIIMIVLLSIQTGIGVAQEVLDIKAHMNQMRNREIETSLTNEQLMKEDPQQILIQLTPFENDKDYFISYNAFRYEVKVAQLHPTPVVRQEVTYRLVNALVDINSANSQDAYEWLLTFREIDFSKPAKEKIHVALLADKPDSKVVRICGVANMQEELLHLEKLLIDENVFRINHDYLGGERWYYTLGWRARLARARLGVKADIVRCIELANAEPDETERVLRIVPDIGYIRQPEAIDYLKNYIDSDKRLPRVKESVPGEPYAAWTLHILADCLENFPIQKRDGRGYNDQEIALCRRWMAQQTSWQIIR